MQTSSHKFLIEFNIISCKLVQSIILDQWFSTWGPEPKGVRIILRVRVDQLSIVIETNETTF